LIEMMNHGYCVRKKKHEYVQMYKFPIMKKEFQMMTTYVLSLLR
jgi:hypothetical protein